MVLIGGQSKLDAPIVSNVLSLGVDTIHIQYLLPSNDSKVAVLINHALGLIQEPLLGLRLPPVNNITWEEKEFALIVRSTQISPFASY